MFRSGKYNLKIRGGTRVSLRPYFSSECLSDLLDNRVGKEGTREEAREGGRKRKGRKILSEREIERHNGKEVPLHRCTAA